MQLKSYLDCVNPRNVTSSSYLEAEFKGRLFTAGNLPV